MQGSQSDEDMSDSVDGDSEDEAWTPSRDGHSSKRKLGARVQPVTLQLVRCTLYMLVTRIQVAKAAACVFVNVASLMASY